MKSPGVAAWDNAQILDAANRGMRKACLTANRGHRRSSHAGVRYASCRPKQSPCGRQRATPARRCFFVTTAKAGVPVQRVESCTTGFPLSRITGDQRCRRSSCPRVSRFGSELCHFCGLVPMHPRALLKAFARIEMQHPRHGPVDAIAHPGGAQRQRFGLYGLSRFSSRSTVCTQGWGLVWLEPACQGPSRS
jgi:hypothetical protein